MTRTPRLSVAAPIPATFARAAFPLGGIGTGNVSLGARGELRDWEIQNRSNKGGVNPCTFFAISARPDGSDRITRVLEAWPAGPRDWAQGTAGEAEGLPRFASATLRGEYPFAQVDFDDDSVPVRVSLFAFTPLVPLEPDDSGIPAAVFRYTVENPGTVPVSVSIAGSLTHRGGLERSGSYRGRQSVEWREEPGLRGLAFDVDLAATDPEYGTMSLLTSASDASAIPGWVEGRAGDFWAEFAATGRLRPLPPAEFGREDPAWLESVDQDLWRELLTPKRRTGSLAATQVVPPGEAREFEFVLAWHFPNRVNGWDGDVLFFEDGAQPELGMTRNHYATRWPDAWTAGVYLLRDRERLERATSAFHAALFGSTLDPAVLQAVSASIATARSTTCFRVEDGTFFGWEGSDGDGGWGGSCTHVWSYAQTLAWLFPGLERGARRVEFLDETEPDGRQRFRANSRFGRPFDWPGAADGQLATIVRLHREWRFSGDDAFLRELWPAARASLDYALRTWDSDGDGLLEAFTHNTYDIEFAGPEPLTGILLLAALRAATRMAAHLGDEDARARYAALTGTAEPALDARLFNGEYYVQDVADVDERQNQVGTGVLSDQLLGQWHAHLNGLGDLLPREHLRSAVHAVYSHNFRADLRAHPNANRAFAFGDEGGLLLASWPRGGRPRFPMRYSDEVWSGVEHHVAAELVYAGFVEEALTLVRTTRARHTGETRSPWDEVEAGHHYARSMSAWSLLLAFSGVQYDAVARTLGFDPVADGTYFFSTGTGWGRATIADDSIELALDHGTLELESLELRGRRVAGPLALTAGRGPAQRMRS
ncbi:GH116 family glycosyl-hydrolase [Jiangella anatolica]|uniref:Glucosylceramidase n=1 Tax=Jiangella anatolica TaxID=2670374 RepID=A0A2W2CEC5_9ACTN|nr:GH116 family glycosyl-hydrolase [Jiangella anatolica]PZF86647.1 hypothetical protein C1I92_00250 [Jiangella anatolica]